MSNLLNLFDNSRYRKIPGDKCQGGENPVREEIELKTKCTSNYLNQSQLVGLNNKTHHKHEDCRGKRKIAK